jgi:hypothetical protein
MPLTMEDRRRGGLVCAARHEWRGPKFKIPKHVDPVLRFLFEEMHRQQCTDQDLSTRTGIHVRSFYHWRATSQPTVGNLQACLNALGYELTVRKAKDVE